MNGRVRIADVGRICQRKLRALGPCRQRKISAGADGTGACSMGREILEDFSGKMFRGHYAEVAVIEEPPPKSFFEAVRAIGFKIPCHVRETNEEISEPIPS